MSASSLLLSSLNLATEQLISVNQVDPEVAAELGMFSLA